MNKNVPKILIKHSRIEINNYELGDSSKLEYIFSVWNPRLYQSFPKGIEYNEETKKLFLPRGIDISWVENTFYSTPEIDRKCDEYISTEPTPIKYLTRDETQLKALKFILAKDEYTKTKSKSQLSINIGTGKGKTFVTIAAICFTGARAIIITSSINWLEQWKEKIFEYTPIKPDEIYMISGAASIDKIKNRDPSKYKIFLASHSTLRSYGDKRGWDSIDELFKYLKCEMKVYDEAHLYFDNMCNIDFHSNTKKTIYLTATPERSDKEENEIYQLYFKNVPSIDLFDENRDPHTHYVAMHFNSHPSPMDINTCKNMYGLDRNKYTEYVVQRPMFKLLVNVLVDMFSKTPGKVLIYIGTNSAIRVVYDHIVSQFPFLRNSVGIYTSVIKENKLMQLNKKFILSTTKSTGAASDIKDLMVTINLAEPFRSAVLAKQTLGRTRADETMYVDVVDSGFYFTKSYYESKKPIFGTYAKSCTDIMMSDKELEERNNAIEKYHKDYKIMGVTIFK